MVAQRELPRGLVLLACLMGYLALRAVWNLVFHLEDFVPFLVEALFFSLLVFGISLRYRVAFIAFIVFFGGQLLECALGMVTAEITYVNGSVCVALKAALLAWIICYKSYFFTARRKGHEEPNVSNT